MADLNALRAALGRIGFSVEAADAITADTQQGYSSLSEFERMSEDAVSTLCKTLRRPGGTIPNPNAGNPGQQPTIPNPGIMTSQRAEDNLKLMVYYLKLSTRLHRARTAANITLASIRAVEAQREMESKHVNPTTPPKIDDKNWQKTMESIRDYLRSTLGETKIPLSYIVREEVEPPVDPDLAVYVDLQQEMIARAPHTLPCYPADNHKVYDIVAEITRDDTSWAYVKPAQRARDGRRAFLGLLDHFLGINNVDNVVAAAEHKLKTTVYNGETRRWDFERYCNVHATQHAILESQVDHGYSGLDPRSKVRHLLDGIKTRNLDTIKAMVLADATLRQDYDRCVNLFKDFIKQSGAGDRNPSVSISSVKTGGGSNSNVHVEDRYYTKKEYDKLSYEQKGALKARRAKRKKKGGDSGGDGDRGDTQKAYKKLKRTVSQLTAKIKSLEAGNDADDTDAASDAEAATEVTSNRSNSALQRQSTNRSR